jgi:hypothetical protein
MTNLDQHLATSRIQMRTGGVTGVIVLYRPSFKQSLIHVDCQKFVAMWRRARQGLSSDFPDRAKPSISISTDRSTSAEVASVHVSRHTCSQGIPWLI